MQRSYSVRDTNTGSKFKVSKVVPPNKGNLFRNRSVGTVPREKRNWLLLKCIKPAKDINSEDEESDMDN